LPTEIAKYIRKGGLDHVVLHGPLKDAKCKLLTRNLQKKMTKTGKRWKEFRNVHSFQKGMKIAFEGSCEKPNQDIKVLIIF